MPYKPSNFRFLCSIEDDLQPNGDSPGGYVVVMKGAAALNIGDLVFLSAAHTVNKSNVEADYNSGIGVVVGGHLTNMVAMQDDIDVGEPACSANGLVLVGILGKFKVVSDAAITAGNKITGGTVTAGRAATATITTDLAAGDSGRLMGTALETAGGAAIKMLALINVH